MAQAFFSVDAEAQNTRLSENNDIGWYTVSLTHKISKKWSAQAEYQWRRTEFGKSWQQSLLRPAINYQVTPALQVQLAYVWAETYPYGEYTINSFGKTFPEHRVAEQVQINDEIGRVGLTHRFRLEQRWLAKYNSAASEKPDDFTFLNRFRYMLRLQCPLQGKTLDDKEFYAAAYDELFIGLGKNVGENIFDQNRTALLVGYKLNRHYRAEGGYFTQTLQLGREVTNRNVIQYNKGFIVSLIMNTGNGKK